MSWWELLRKPCPGWPDRPFPFNNAASSYSVDRYDALIQQSILCQKIKQHTALSAVTSALTIAAVARRRFLYAGLFTAITAMSASAISRHWVDMKYMQQYELAASVFEKSAR